MYPLLVKAFVDKTRQDIEQKQPKLILVRAGTCFACPANFAIGEFLQTYGLIDLIKAHYVAPVLTGYYDVFQCK
jgi:hypothetical protein